MKSSTPNHILIKGRVTDGLVESSFFTGIPWVREQFINKLGIDPYPGTFNLDITEDEEMDKWKEIKKRKGIEIIPAAPEFCSASCFHATVCGKIKGAVIIPRVDGYPESKMEIISVYKIRDALSLNSGDPVTVEFL